MKYRYCFLSFLIAIFLFSCQKDDFSDLLPGTWYSEKVLVSGTDISALTQFQVEFKSDKNFTQKTISDVNGIQVASEKSGTWLLSNKEIELQFSSELPQKWLIQHLNSSQLEVLFSRNGEQFRVHFYKK